LTVAKTVEFLVTGVATGMLYALVALGFVVVYKVSGVLNFAQGALVAVGAFAVWWLVVRSGWLDPLGDGSVVEFVTACLVAAGVAAIVSAVIDVGLLRRLADEPAFSLAMVTVGADIILRTLVASRLPIGANAIGSPLAGRTLRLGDTSVAYVDVWTIGLAVGIVVLVGLALRYSRLGLAVRAVAIDREAAAAVGVPVPTVVTSAWCVAGVLAVVAATMQLSRSGQGLEPSTAFFALRSFPAAILGGLSSLPGAIVGGLLVGLVEAYFQFFHPTALGGNFHLVAPYAVMVAVLLFRPHGLFGTAEVGRA
jgi:branched-chain amino acid transport system permease protein